MSEDLRKQSKAAFNAVYQDDPAEFNRIAQEAIKDQVRSRIKTIRGEIRDEVASQFIQKDSATETPPVTSSVPKK